MILRRIVIGIFAATSLAASSAWSASRYTVVISDLHLGLGCKTKTDCHPYEDFRWTDDFRGFLAAINALSNKNTDLILNGDTFELWQSDDVPCTQKGRSHDESCTEKEAVDRITQITTMHHADLQLLAQFASEGTNRLLIVPGNHDAALLFEKVFAVVRGN